MIEASPEAMKDKDEEEIEEKEVVEVEVIEAEVVFNQVHLLFPKHLQDHKSVSFQIISS
jgi:hypothetical protein